MCFGPIQTIHEIGQEETMFAPSPEPLATQLASDYAVNASLAMWSHALMNTDLHPLTPKPAWFDRVDGHLSTAKKTTQTWLIDDYPGVASALPQSLVDYGHNFIAAADQLVTYLAQPLTPSGRADVLALLTELQAEAVQQQFRVKGLQKKVEKFTTFMRETLSSLSADRKDVMASLAGARKEVERLQDRINDLFRELGVTATEAKQAMEAAAMKGISIFGSTFVFSISAVVTTGATFPVIGLGIAVIGLTYAALQDKSKSDAVIEKLREITALQVKLTGEQAQAAGLQAMAAAIESLGDVARASLTNMIGSVHYWADVADGLTLAKELVEKGVDVRALAPFQNIAAARGSWVKIVESAKNVQSSVLKIERSIDIKETAA
jgi:hypothetical protein